MSLALMGDGVEESFVFRVVFTTSDLRVVSRRHSERRCLENKQNTKTGMKTNSPNLKSCVVREFAGWVRGSGTSRLIDGRVARGYSAPGVLPTASRV